MAPSSKLAALFFAFAVVAAAALAPAAEARVQGFNHEAASEPAIAAAGESKAATGGGAPTLPGLPGLPFPLFPFLTLPFPLIPIGGSPGGGGAPPSAGSGFRFPFPLPLPFPAPASPGGASVVWVRLPGVPVPVPQLAGLATVSSITRLAGGTGAAIAAAAKGVLDAAVVDDVVRGLPDEQQRADAAGDLLRGVQVAGEHGAHLPVPRHQWRPEQVPPAPRRHDEDDDAPQHLRRHGPTSDVLHVQQ